MTFKLRLDGKEIASVDEQVLSVRLQTARGETAATGIAPNEGVVDIILEKVAPGGPIRLDQLEARQMQEIRDRAEEGMSVGFARDFQVNPQGLRADQGVHDETLREGGPRRNDQTVTSGPSRDLSEGLAQGDTETLTARLEAFAEHGDTDRAISENPAGGAVQSGTAPDSISSSDSPSTRSDSGAGSTTSDSDDDGSSSGPKGSGSESEAPSSSESETPSSGLNLGGGKSSGTTAKSATKSSK